MAIKKEKAIDDIVEGNVRRVLHSTNDDNPSLLNLCFHMGQSSSPHTYCTLLQSKKERKKDSGRFGELIGPRLHLTIAFRRVFMKLLH
jgi:hypothetical protein